MKTFDMVGRRVVRVSQEQIKTNAGMAWCVNWIEFDDGTVLIPSVTECEDLDYGVYFISVGKEKES